MYAALTNTDGQPVWPSQAWSSGQPVYEQVGQTAYPSTSYGTDVDGAVVPQFGQSNVEGGSVLMSAGTTRVGIVTRRLIRARSDPVYIQIRD